MSVQVETSEGVEEAGQVEMATMREALRIFVERKMFETIPALVEQVRVSEEKYVLEGSQMDGSIASLCTRTVKQLIEMKYGPLRGVEYRPPVSNGRWNW